MDDFTPPVEPVLDPTQDILQVPIKLLLFIDKRPTSGEYAQQLRHHLKELGGDHPFHLDVVDVSEQPYLAEHFKLVATPALVKFSPGLQQVLKGSTIHAQLEHWWPQWQAEAAATLEQLQQESLAARSGVSLGQTNLAHSIEVMKLSDEIFRLNQEKDELEAQLQFKDRIVAMLAHDLRNPLTAASIAVDTLEMGHRAQVDNRKPKLSSELTAQLLRHAKTQIRAIDRMITDILQTAKGATVDLQIQPQATHLRPLVLGVLEAMDSKVRNNQQTVAVEIPQDLPLVYIDVSQVQRVLFNLVDNAIKYTPLGGHISISALHRTTQKVQVTIQDSGPGIPAENQETIFEESFRLQRDQGKDGYGLGLALCQRILRAHYGRIWVESNPGCGSQFFFTLPVYRR